MAAVAAAVIAALGTAYAADQSNSNSLISQAGQGKKPQQGGTDYSPTALRFAPGVQGTGDGSMPLKAALDSPPPADQGSAFSTDYSKFQAPTSAETAPPPTEQPATTQPTQDSTASTIAQLGGLGLSLGQALRGSDPQPMQPAQVGGQGYQPTALAALQAMMQRKRMMGY